MKKASKSDYALIGGYLWKLNIGAKGLYSNIIAVLFGQLAAMLSHHNKVLVIRFDLSVSIYTNANDNIKKLNNSIREWLRRKYSIKRIAYVWVREYETAKRQHYHIVMILDANKVISSWDLMDYASKRWSYLTEVFLEDGAVIDAGRLWHIKDKILIRGDEIKRVKIGYWLSYLAKARGKGYKANHAKDYGASKIKAKIMK
ncbi:MAG: inovirus-type Gp2 protein [Colwellia sp.]|nr:inovirus-type Gp2 protein [Colwellia sp.]